jgi:2-polyprenyl-6-methoxyphenol hydroxylase-like FAD-dependent oxidoreductase
LIKPFIHHGTNETQGDYERASPCKPVDLPQTLLEPILIRYATAHGFKVRFDTTLIHFKEHEGSDVITATVKDRLSGNEYEIRTKYLFGADGASSQVVKQLDLPMDRQPGQGLALNVLVKTDLSHLVGTRKGNLHWIFQPDKEHPAFGWACIARMVKPWDEWMFIMLPDRDVDLSIKPTMEEYEERLRDFIGDDTPAEILNVSRWYINEVVAKTYSRGNM